MLWWMTTASSPSRTAMVTVSLVCSLKSSQTGLAQRRMSRSALTALASSTSPRSLNVVSSRYAVDLWMSSSLATSVTPDHPRRDKNSITEMARSTDCTEGLLRITAHISADPTLPSVSWLDLPGASRLHAPRLLARLVPLPVAPDLGDRSVRPSILLGVHPVPHAPVLAALVVEPQAVRAGPDPG